MNTSYEQTTAAKLPNSEKEFPPGSVAFRHYIQRKFPRKPHEQVSQWLSRVNRELRLSPASRLSKLYYDQGKDNVRMTTSEYTKIFGSTPIRTPDKRLTENAELREELAEIKALIRADMDGRNARIRLLLEAFAG